MKKRSLVLFLPLLILLWIPNVSFSSQCTDYTGIVPCGGDTCPCELCDFFVMINRVMRFFLFSESYNGGVPIALAAAIVMIMIGGFMYLIGYGSPEGGPGMISKAKSIFTSVAFGLLIAYGAWIIVNTFFLLIGVADWTGLKGGWFTINCG